MINEIQNACEEIRRVDEEQKRKRINRNEFYLCAKCGKTVEIDRKFWNTGQMIDGLFFCIDCIDEEIILYDGENNKRIGVVKSEYEAIGLITKFLQENCSGEGGISDLEIESNYNQYPTLDEQCKHYNFYYSKQ